MQKRQEISGWGNFPVSRGNLSRPEWLDKIVLDDSKIISRGLGRSYGDASLNQDHSVILTERLNHMIAFDPERGVLTAECGVTLREILEIFIPKGWFLPVTPGTKFVTLGGSIASDVHGKNHHIDGSLGSHIQSLTLLLANGEKIECSPEKNRELFWATIGGMGLTGIILKAKIQLIPIETSYLVSQNFPAKDLEELLQKFEELTTEDKYSVAWFDCLAKGNELGRGIVMNARHAKRQDLPSHIKEPLIVNHQSFLSIPKYASLKLFNPTLAPYFNKIYYDLKSRKGESRVTSYDPFFYPLDFLENWNLLYGKKGFLQYQFVIPLEAGYGALREILDVFSQNQVGSFLSVLKKFGKHNPGYLSFPFEGYTVALDFPVTDQIWGILDQVDQLVLKYKGRVYLAKDARLAPSTFREMYPRFQEWQRIKQEVDPQGVFSSDLSRRLKMEEKT